MTRILYHIGMPKTGTSLLQGTMARAVVTLREHGVLYPRAGRAGVAHHALTQTLREQGPAERAAFLADLGREVAAACAEDPAPRMALVSSEGMVNLCGVELAPAFAEFMAVPGPGMQGSAIIVLREMTSFLESMYFQTTRFRAVDWTFDEFLGSRPKWMRNFLAGLNMIKARMRDDFEIMTAAPGYNVLRTFEARLSLPEGLLDAPSREVGPTERPSLKGQVALVHLPWLEVQIGFKIRRRALSRLLSDGAVFPEDVANFTIYAPGQRAKMAATGIAIMEEAGFGSYAALTRSMAPSTLPHHVIDRALLTPEDIARVAALRDVIEEKPRVDRATRQAIRRATRLNAAVSPATPAD
ncbi:MAG: hypothetical protein ACT4OK_12685 [Gemmobacter sp.]